MKEEYIRRYVNYAMKHQKGQDIPKEIVDNYWRPDNLVVFVNGEKIESKDSFGYYMTYFNGKYLLPLSDIFLKKIDGVTITKKAGNRTFSYKDKTYTIINQTNLKKNEIAYNATKEEVETVLGIKIKLDYQNEKAKIQIR